MSLARIKRFTRETGSRHDGRVLPAQARPLRAGLSWIPSSSSVLICNKLLRLSSSFSLPSCSCKLRKSINRFCEASHTTVHAFFLWNIKNSRFSRRDFSRRAVALSSRMGAYVSFLFHESYNAFMKHITRVSERRHYTTRERHCQEERRSIIEIYCTVMRAVTVLSFGKITRHHSHLKEKLPAENP